MLTTSTIFVLGVVPSIVWVSNGQVLCEPCGDGEIPSNEGRCPSLTRKSSSLMAQTPMCIEIQLELFQQGCCEQPPRDRCTLCPDGSSFMGSSVVPNFSPNEGDFSCADLNSDVAYLDYLFESGVCDDTLLRRSASWCGCPGVQRTCSLCSNGERPPNPTLIDPVYYGWDCDTFDFVSSYFSEGECMGLVNSIFEFDAPSFCGCSNSQIPDVCDLCPPGQMIANPNLPLGHNDKFTCRELALSTRYIPAEGPCERALSAHNSNGYISACCAPVDKVPKIYGGTAAGPSKFGTFQWWIPTFLLLLSVSLLRG
jgi:hypothetical protein